MKEIILDLHNEKRNYIAGGLDRIHTPACRMATMQWDNELAYLAELNVKQCKMAHDKCHNTKAFRYSGQNLALLNYVNVDDSERMFTMAVSKWFSESENTPMDYIRAYPAHLNDRFVNSIIKNWNIYIMVRFHYCQNNCPFHGFNDRS